MARGTVLGPQHDNFSRQFGQKRVLTLGELFCIVAECDAINFLETFKMNYKMSLFDMFPSSLRLPNIPVNNLPTSIKT